ncbi:hypothetical protein H0H81_002842 [Sphagnurus paluster]|uniref:RRM domain-containing protein n=1 Tax=Sphagnurus paluster TaxID=117069 RepID=A0A9P7FVI7_9AGAR|nr:hypothetical protein H0H81_002842 [Sphagnurus paluster]
MFSNALRTQARLALSSCRARVSMVAASRLVSRAPAVPSMTTSRLLSTSQPIMYGYDGVRERRPRPAGEASKTNLFVGNLPFSVEEHELREKFSVFGDIESIRIAYRPDGTARGFAHISYANEADAAAAVKSVTEEPVYLLDRDLRVDFAQERERTPPAREPTHSLYFHGFRGTQDELRQATRSFEGSIINIHFIKDRDTGMLKGNGFIEFMSVERATEALNELNGVAISDEETLLLRYAYPKSEDGDRRPARGGRDGGDRRGGGGGGFRGGRGGGGGGGGNHERSDFGRRREPSW